MPIMPSAMAVTYVVTARLPSNRPMMPVRAMPPSKTRMTFIPVKASTITARYGINLYHSNAAGSMVDSPLDRAASKIVVMTAAGKTIQKLVRNLSRMFVRWVRTAAIVVSEMNDKLSPNMAPPTTAAAAIAILTPLSSWMPRAIGASAAIVPVDVPIAIEMKAAMTNRPLNRSEGGSNVNAALTVASIAPIASATLENAPASKKMNTMMRMLGFPAPWATRSTVWVTLPFVIIAATMTAIKAAIKAGNL